MSDVDPETGDVIHEVSNLHELVNSYTQFPTFGSWFDLKYPMVFTHKRSIY